MLGEIERDKTERFFLIVSCAGTEPSTEVEADDGPERRERRSYKRNRRRRKMIRRMMLKMAMKTRVMMMKDGMKLRRGRVPIRVMAPAMMMMMMMMKGYRRRGIRMTMMPPNRLLQLSHPSRSLVAHDPLAAVCVRACVRVSKCISVIS